MKWKDKKKVLKHIVKLLLRGYHVTVFFQTKNGGSCATHFSVPDFLLGKRVFMQHMSDGKPFNHKDIKVSILNVKH